MKQLTAKLLHEKIKRGWTATDFANYLELDSTADFWKLLEKQFSGNTFKEFRSLLHSNEKHRKRVKERENPAVDECEENITSELKAQQYEADTSFEPANDEFDFALFTTESSPEGPLSVEELPSLEPSEQSSPTLQDLLYNLDQLLIQLNEEELIHKDIVSSRIEIRNQILSHKEELIKIRTTIAEHESAINTLLSSLDETKEKMSESTAKIQLLRESKAKLEADIDKAKQVSILVCNTGEIDIDTQSDIKFPDSSALFAQIVEEEELGSLTIKQTKALARVIELVRSLIMQGTPYEIAFDSIVAETYFKKAIS